MYRLMICTAVFLEAIICAPQQAISQEHTFRVFTENGVTIARTTGGPKYTGELFIYEKEKVLDIEQSEEALLHRPVQFLADESGSFFITDAGQACIQVFDADGNHLRTIGRKGQGPGEFMYGRILLIQQDVIQVYDLSQQRTTRFNTDGNLIDVTRLPTNTGMVLPISFYILPDERRLLLTNDMIPADMENTQSGAVVLSAAGDTLCVVTTPQMQVAQNTSISFQGRTSTQPMPLLFGPSPTSVFHQTHGIILSTSIDPQLDIYNLEGILKRTIQLELVREPVTAADRRMLQQTLRQNAANANEALRPMMESVVERTQFADEKAFWFTVEIDDAGYFWLDTNSLLTTTEGVAHSYHVLSPEGEYLGMTTRPFRFGSSVSRGRFLILEEDSESGEILPTIYRIRPAVSGLKYPD